MRGTASSLVLSLVGTMMPCHVSALGANERMPFVVPACREQKFGGVPGDHIDCDFYCGYLSNAVAAELASACVEEIDCWDGLPSKLSLAPAPATICPSHASIAVASSCTVPDSALSSLFAATSSFFGASEEACSQTKVDCSEPRDLCVLSEAKSEAHRVAWQVAPEEIRLDNVGRAWNSSLLCTDVVRCL